jgi:hypothetical protein
MTKDFNTEDTVIGGSPPPFFVSVDSKQLSILVSPVESTLVGARVGVDSKEVIGRSLKHFCKG